MKKIILSTVVVAISATFFSATTYKKGDLRGTFVIDIVK